MQLLVVSQQQLHLLDWTCTHSAVGCLDTCMHSSSRVAALCYGQCDCLIRKYTKAVMLCSKSVVQNLGIMRQANSRCTSEKLFNILRPQAVLVYCCALHSALKIIVSNIKRSLQPTCVGELTLRARSDSRGVVTIMAATAWQHLLAS